jgi:hypothetical protein
VNAVCASHKRRKLFMEVQKSGDDNNDLYTYNTLNLRQDGGVRWPSVYLMMLRCLELKESIKRIIRRLKNDGNVTNEAYNPLTDSLDDDKWDEVTELVNFLRAPYEMTKRLKGNNSSSRFGSLWQTLTNLQALWTLYSSMSERPHSSKYFEKAVKFGLKKLNTYFDRILIQPNISYYAVATALHPKICLTWFCTQWKHHPQWYKIAEESIKKVFKQYLEREIEPEELQLLQPLQRKLLRSSDNGDSGDDIYKQAMEVDLQLLQNSKNKRQKRVSELDEYFDSLQYDLTNASDSQLAVLNQPWGWWLNIGRSKYPVMFKITTDFIFIPSTSCECKRCFSSAKQTITCDQNQLSRATIGALQLQKNWLQNDVVVSDLLKLQDHIRKMEEKERNRSRHSLLEVDANPDG